MIEDILKHFEKQYPREACGIIGIVKGKKEFFPCENVSDTDEDFVMSSTDYLNVKRKADIFAIVHNHPDASNEASEYDINCCNALGIPYYIYSYPDMELNIVEPKKLSNPLIGRIYEFGVRDCFEAARDWLAKENIIVPPRDPFEDDWWKKGLNYFSEKNLNDWNFYKVNTPEKNDIITFSVQSAVPNHCGVYINNDIFFHHAVGRISCRESLYPFWAKHLVGFYRYVA